MGSLIVVVSSSAAARLAEAERLLLDRSAASEAGHGSRTGGPCDARHCRGARGLAARGLTWPMKSTALTPRSQFQPSDDMNGQIEPSPQTCGVRLCSDRIGGQRTQHRGSPLPPLYREAQGPSHSTRRTPVRLPARRLLRG